MKLGNTTEISKHSRVQIPLYKWLLALELKNCTKAHIKVFWHCMKSVQIRSYFWSVFSCIRTEYKKIRTRKIFVFGHFSHSLVFSNFTWFFNLSKNILQTIVVPNKILQVVIEKAGPSFLFSVNIIERINSSHSPSAVAWSCFSWM